MQRQLCLLLLPTFMLFFQQDFPKSCPDTFITKVIDTSNVVSFKESEIVLHHPRYVVTFSSSTMDFVSNSDAPDLAWAGSNLEEVTPELRENRIVYSREGFDEEYVIKPNSIEQIFILHENPSPGSDFIVQGDILSTGDLITTNNGWSWKNNVGEITLSHAYAFDNKGETVPVTMIVNQSSSKIVVRDEDLNNAEFPVTIDPEIGTNDFRISEMGSDGDISFNGFDPAVAYNTNSNRYLVVWEGDLNGEREIWGQLLDGTSLSEIGNEFQISNTPGNANFDAQAPDVVSSPNSFLVAWHADHDTPPLNDNESDIYIQLVNTSGALILTDEVKISTMGIDGDALSGSAAAVTFNSTQNEFLVAWRGDDGINSGNEIYIQLLDINGNEIGTDDRLISDMGNPASTTANASAPDVTWNSEEDQYLVVWHSDDDNVDNEFEIYGQRLAGSNGGPIGSNDFKISDMGDGTTSYAAFNPSVAYNPTSNNYLVVWNADDNAGGVINNENEIYGQLLDKFGVEIGADDFRISDMGPDGNANYDALSPSVSADPFLDEYIVTWHGDDNTSPLIDNEIEIFGQIVSSSGTPTGTNDFRLSDVGGSGNTTYNAASVASGYNGSSREFLIVWEADDPVGSIVDSEFEIWGQRFAEKETEPIAQPTSFSTSSITQSSYTVSFNAASGAPEGYIALRRSGSSPTDIPVDQTAYTEGATIGASTVAYVGSAASFNDTGLSPSTTYFYDIFSFNGVNSSLNYRTTSPLQGSETTLAAEPTTQANEVSFSSIGTSSVTINYINGNGLSRFVVAREGSAVNAFPQDGNSYTENNVFGSGSDLGSGNYVVGSGSGPITITGLNVATEYHFRVFEFNGTGGLSNYNSGTASNNPASVFTLSLEPGNQPTALSLTGITANSMNGSFTAAVGTPDGYLVLRKADSSPTGTPIDGQNYNVDDVIGDATVIAEGSSTSFSSTGLAPGTEYYYAIFSYSGSGTTFNYNIASPLTGNAFTLAAEPTTQPTSAVFSSVTPTSMDVDFTAASGSPSGYLVLRRTSASPTGVPLDGTEYTVGQTIGDGEVVLSGSSTSFSNSGLTSATEYFFDFFSYNGNGASRDYLQTGPLEASQTTTEAQPADQATELTFSNFTTASMDGSFTAAASGATGYVVLRRLGASPIDVPEDGTEYNAGGVLGDSRVVHAGAGLSFTSDGLDAGIIYHYDVFAYNGSGANINYNETLPLENSAITISPAPEALDPTQITATSFNAPWNAATGATKYELDVSSDDFATFVAGYQAREVTTGLEEAVTGLSPSTAYKFRVRAVNASGKSANSLDKTLTTLDDAAPNPLQMTAPNVVKNGAEYTISVTLTNGSGTRVVNFSSRGIRAPDFQTESVSSTSDDYQVKVAESELDELGLEYSFEATDDLTTTPVTRSGYIYVEISNEQESIPGLSSGGRVENYRIISIPYQLEDNLVQSIFGELGNYDPGVWRLIRYQNGKNRDFPAFNRIVQGLGYWFNSLNPVEIRLGPGSAPNFNQSNEFTLSLSQGWNQIGAPYPFDMSWSEILAANPTANIGSLKVFQPSGATLDDSDILREWSGGFVFADNAIEITFPVATNSSAARIKKYEITSGDIGSPEWFVPITLIHGDGVNEMIGFGMHPKASDSKDRYDDITVPRFFNYLEMSTTHHEFFAPLFTRDVVNSVEEYRWRFNIQSNFRGASARIQWDPDRMGDNEASLILVDYQAEKFIDMKATDRYEFDPDQTKEVEIIYSVKGFAPARSASTILGTPYPNPAFDVLNIPILINNSQQVAVDILDVNGRKIRSLYNGQLIGGAHSLVWKCNDEASNKVRAGVYIIQLVTEEKNQFKKIVIR